MLNKAAVLLECEVQELTGEIGLMTGEERRWLEAYRKLPKDKRMSTLLFVETLASPVPQEPPTKAENPSYQIGKKSS